MVVRLCGRNVKAESRVMSCIHPAFGFRLSAFVFTCCCSALHENGNLFRDRSLVYAKM